MLNAPGCSQHIGYYRTMDESNNQSPIRNLRLMRNNLYVNLIWHCYQTVPYLHVWHCQLNNMPDIGALGYFEPPTHHAKVMYTTTHTD